MPNHARILAFLFLAVAVGLSGCPEWTVPDQGNPVTPPPPPERPAGPTHPNGLIKLSMNAPVTLESCHGRVVAFTDGRPTIVQLTSYTGASGESFPSVMLRMLVSTTSPATMVGQTVKGELFVQLQPGGTVWCSPAGEFVDVSIVSFGRDALSVDITGGRLVASNSHEEVAIRGSMLAVLK
jgi:hypothetical protein